VIDDVNDGGCDENECNYLRKSMEYFVEEEKINRAQKGHMVERGEDHLHDR
jgi:hypothetical protein